MAVDFSKLKPGDLVISLTDCEPSRHKGYVTTVVAIERVNDNLRLRYNSSDGGDTCSSNFSEWDLYKSKARRTLNLPTWF